MKWAEKWTPRIKAILPLACLIIVGVAIATVMYCNQASKIANDLVDSELSAKAQAAAVRISDWVGSSLTETAALSTDQAVRNLVTVQDEENAADVALFMKAIAKSSKQYKSVALVDANGLALAVSDSKLAKELDLSGDENFQKAARGETAISGVYASGRNQVFTILQPVYKAGQDSEIAGVLVFAVDMKWITKKFVKPLRMGDAGSTYLAEASGLVISHSNNKMILNLNLSEHAYGRDIMAQKAGRLEYEIPPTEEHAPVNMTAQVQPVDAAGWLLVLELPTAKHTASITSLVVTTYATGIIVGFILFFALWLMIDYQASLECLAAMHKDLIFCEKLALIVLLFTMISLSFGQVIARNIFQTGFMWVDEVLRIEVLWVAFLGAGLAAEYNRHIKIDVLSHIMGGGRGSRILDTSAQVFALVVCLALFHASCLYIQSEARFPACNLIEGIPDWVFRLVIPYFFLAMSIRCMINIRRIFKGTFTRTVEP